MPTTTKTHNLTAAIADAAVEITKEHSDMLSLMAKGEEKAERIGELLISLEPMLKAASVNLTDFCKTSLPFGKSAAYEYKKIARGEVSFAYVTQRKQNSAPAEKSLEELFKQNVIERWEEEEEEDFGAGLALLHGRKFNHKHPQKIELLNKTGGVLNSYNYGFLFALAYDCMSYMKAEALKKCDIANVKTLTSEQDVLLKALCLSHDEVTILVALMMNEDVNMEGLRNGGHISNHPLREAYMELFPNSHGTSRLAETWCSEAMFETAIDYHQNEGNMATADELREMKPPKGPADSATDFWILSTRAAKTLQ